MSEFFKILNKFDKINPEVLFEMNNASVTRGNGMKLKVQRYNTIGRKSFFNVRVVDYWNRLPASVINSKIIDIFNSFHYFPYDHISVFDFSIVCPISSQKSTLILS